MEILLTISYALIFLLVIRRWNFFSLTEIPKTWVGVVFILKILCGIALSIIYTYYYTDRSTADVFKFFDDSQIMFNALKTQPIHFFKMVSGIDSHSPELVEYYNKMKYWYNIDVLPNDNQTMIRLNALFRLFSLGYYSVPIVFINFLSFVGLICLFHFFQPWLKNKSKEFFLLLMLLPSVLLWGSGLLKDGMLFFAMGWFLYRFNRVIYSPHSTKNLFNFAVAFILLLYIKLYILALLIPGLIAWVWSRHDTTWKISLKFLALYFIYIVIAFNIGRVYNNYDLSDMLFCKQRDFYILAERTNAQSTINMPRLQPTTWSIISNSPAAILRVFIRPSIFDSNTLFVFLAAIENLFILGIGLCSFIFFRRNDNFSHPVFWLSIFFVTCLFALIGLTTPILGEMVRYKIPALPFLMFIFISFYQRERVFKIKP